MGIKRFIFLIILILLAGYVILGREKDPDTLNVLLKPTAEPVVEGVDPVSVLLNDAAYEIYFQEIGEDLKLIPNFSEKKSTEKTSSENKCTYGVNGGFYKKEGGPLGLFAVNGKIIGKEIESATFNGYFWKKGKDMSLDWNKPEGWEGTDFILQSGPLMDINYLGKGSFVDEEERRRVLVANDKNGKFFFLVLFQKENTFGGPKLVDMAEILRKSGIADFNLALNLDGGSASAFYGENGAKLWELVSVGSFFCGK